MKPSANPSPTDITVRARDLRNAALRGLAVTMATVAARGKESVRTRVRRDRMALERR